jgi:hypothetical protein
MMTAFATLPNAEHSHRGRRRTGKSHNVLERYRHVARRAEASSLICAQKRRIPDWRGFGCCWHAAGLAQLGIEPRSQIGDTLCTARPLVELVEGERCGNSLRASQAQADLQAGIGRRW